MWIPNKDCKLHILTKPPQLYVRNEHIVEFTSAVYGGTIVCIVVLKLEIDLAFEIVCDILADYHL